MWYRIGSNGEAFRGIAVEFDNGQDFTYYWSSELPVGTGFRCRELFQPGPRASTRQGDLAQAWRKATASGSTRSATSICDYGEKIGGALPAKIVRVWLIAVSLFQRTRESANMRTFPS